jgi:hypothetical protein
MQAVRIKIDDSLKFVQELLHKNEFRDFELTEQDPDFIISETIPDEPKLFVVIWDKHDIKAIEKISRERHKFLRGFFIKDEIEAFPSQLIETLTNISTELSFIADLRRKSEEVKDKGEYIEIGKYVKIGKDSRKLEDYFSSPRFTSLFIDRPMLQMMSRLARILEDMQPALQKLENHYENPVGSIIKNSGLNATNGFDKTVVDDLSRLMVSQPLQIEPILLTGETGVGKTLIARWIHEQAKQSGLKGTFQEINSSGLSQTLLESELFGHVKGSFTDAKQDKPGKALLALGGVLFLDEIGDMPLDIQPRVMKFIEEKTFTPEGWYGVTPFYTPMLVVAATNKDLGAEVAGGRFRKDFYARLRHRVQIPSIEERKASLNAIIDFILQNPMVSGQGKIKYISRDALGKFKLIKYEENFRGLERIVRDVAYKTRDCGLDIILPEIIEMDSHGESANR